MSALPSWRFDWPASLEEELEPDLVELVELEVLEDFELEEEVLGVEGVEGIDGMEGIDDELGDGRLGAEGAPLVAQPASMTAHSNGRDNSGATGSGAGRMIRCRP